MGKGELAEGWRGKIGRSSGGGRGAEEEGEEPFAKEWVTTVDIDLDVEPRGRRGHIGGALEERLNGEVACDHGIGEDDVYERGRKSGKLGRVRRGERVRRRR
jgi:hypothetical protein